MIEPEIYEESTEQEDIWSVQQLNQTVARVIEGSSLIQGIWLEGEISNLNYHTSGHIYFSLKDEKSAIACTFFKGSNRNLQSRLENGMKILAYGGVSVYQVRGNYQFNVQKVSLSGEGELRLRIEQLKKRLAAEGLFDSVKKKPLPILPLTIGVATAPTGAAIQDIIRVARSRFPRINILLAPCVVQGEGAVNSIVSAITALQLPQFHVDVIIAGRGGGSFEDLMPFNEEPVVRAFSESRIPIVSAVGHQIDHPLSDLAADSYAATPSAAAEKVVPVYDLVDQRLGEYQERLQRSVFLLVKQGKEQLERSSSSRVFLRPQSIFEPFMQQLDWTWKDMQQQMKQKLLEARGFLTAADRFAVVYERALSIKKNKYIVMQERLENFSPLGTLKRGFSVARKASGEVIRSVTDISPEEKIQVLLSDGSFQARVESMDSDLK